MNGCYVITVSDTQTTQDENGDVLATGTCRIRFTPASVLAERKERMDAMITEMRRSMDETQATIRRLLNPERGDAP